MKYNPFIMIITKKENREVEVIEDVLCNQCGCSLKSKEFPNGFIGAVGISVSGSYTSEYLDDMTEYNFSLCEKCLSNLFKSFKIKVETKESEF